MKIKLNQQYKSRWGEVVEISDINDNEVVVLYVDEGYVDVINKDDFIANFKVLKNGCK